MDDFFKVYRSFFSGSLARKPHATRIVFLACLSLSDANGEFVAEPRFISAYANVELDECIHALGELLEPDPNSTTAEEDGRRLLRLSPNRWLVVNKAKYRDKSRASDRKTYMRELMKRRRADERAARASANTFSAPQVQNEDSGNDVSSGVSIVSPKEIKRDKTLNTIGGKLKRTLSDFEAFKAEYPKRDGDYGWKKAGETFERLIKNGTPVEEILAGVKRYKLHCLSRQICGTKYVKHATTFLNGAFWKETYDIIAEAQSIVLPKEDRDYYVVPVTYVDGEEREPGSEVTQEERQHSDIRQANIPYAINESGRTSERFVLSEWFEEKGIHGIDARWDGCKFIVARSKMD